MRSVEWQNGTVRMIDQRLLPTTLQMLTCENVGEVAEAIRDMAIRGAPAIGGAAAFAMALAAHQSQAESRETLLSDLHAAAETLKAARPTAVNLAWAVSRMLRLAESESATEVMRAAVLEGAQQLADEDVDVNRRLGEHGASLIQDGDTILHHCNTGALATVDYGTALGVIRTAHEQGKRIQVLVDETRPRLQGARLTTWELLQYDIPFRLIADNAAGHFLRRGQVDIVLVGADRVAANGDVANKIGTYKLALAAQDNGVPFYPCVPTSTVDLALPTGDDIPIEERSDDEILSLTYQGQPIAPERISVANPAFDVTPYRLVTGIVTENGIAYPPFGLNLGRMVKASS